MLKCKTNFLNSVPLTCTWIILVGRPVKFRPRSSFSWFCCIEPQIQAALDNDEIMMQVRSVCHTSDARGSPCITFWCRTDSLWFFFLFLYDDWYPTHADNINISGMALIYIEEAPMSESDRGDAISRDAWTPPDHWAGIWWVRRRLLQTFEDQCVPLLFCFINSRLFW